MKCKISKNILRACEDVPVAGTKADILMMDKDNYDLMTEAFNADNTNIIATLTKPFGVEFLKVQGRQDSTVPVMTAEVGTFFTTYNQGITFQIFDVNPFTLSQLKKLELSANGVVVMYQDNNYGGQWRIAGTDSGLSLVTSTQEQNNAEIGGGFTIELSSKQKSKGHPFFFGTYTLAGTSNPVYDVAATRTLVDALQVKDTKAITAGTAGATTTFTVADTTDIPVDSNNQYEAHFAGFTDAALLALNGTTEMITVTSATEFTVAYDSTGATVFDGTIS